MKTAFKVIMVFEGCLFFTGLSPVPMQGATVNT